MWILLQQHRVCDYLDLDVMRRRRKVGGGSSSVEVVVVQVLEAAADFGCRG